MMIGDWLNCPEALVSVINFLLLLLGHLFIFKHKKKLTEKEWPKKKKKKEEEEAVHQNIGRLNTVGSLSTIDKVP